MGNPQSILCWHGWRVTLPTEWSPVKIEGDHRKGSIIIADLHATRMAIRWQSIGRRFDVEAWTRRAIAGEVGQLMLDKSSSHIPSGGDWEAGRLFLEPDPPGRDVFAGVDRISHRAIEVVFQSTTRSRMLPDVLLPGIAAMRSDEPNIWSIFDLSVTLPAGWNLIRHRLNAGDLTLSFGKRRETLVVRQLRPATLALARQPLAQWLDAQQRMWKQFYGVRGDVALSSDDASRTIRRKKRFFYLRWIAAERHAIARHGQARNAIAIVDASDASLARDVLDTIGAEAKAPF